MSWECIYFYDLTTLILIELTDTGSQQFCTDQSGNTTYHVDRTRSCEIMEAKLCQPAAAPDPVAGDGVDDQADGGGVAAVGAELRALGHRAGDDGRGSGAEHSLGTPRRPRPQRAEVIAAADERIKPADERTGTGKHDAEADEPVARRTDTKVHHILHQNIAGIFCTGQPASHKAKPACMKNTRNAATSVHVTSAELLHRTEPLSYFAKQKGAGQNHTVRAFAVLSLRLCYHRVAA